MGKKSRKKKYNHNKKHKKEFIDFRTLSKKELKDLSKLWEQKAFVFECKLQKYMYNPRANNEKIERLWGVGKKLWRRLEILERWLLRNNIKV